MKRGLSVLIYLLVIITIFSSSNSIVLKRTDVSDILNYMKEFVERYQIDSNIYPLTLYLDYHNKKDIKKAYILVKFSDKEEKFYFTKLGYLTITFKKDEMSKISEITGYIPKGSRLEGPLLSTAFPVSFTERVKMNLLYLKNYKEKQFQHFSFLYNPQKTKIGKIKKINKFYEKIYENIYKRYIPVELLENYRYIIFTDNLNNVNTEGYINSYGGMLISDEIKKNINNPPAFHEYIESTISNKLGFTNNLTNRMFGDGIAQFILYKICEKYNPNHFYTVSDSINNFRPNVKFDLSNWKYPPYDDYKYTNYGYEIAPYFMAKMNEKYEGKNHLIHDFLEECYKKMKEVNYDYFSVFKKLFSGGIDKQYIIDTKEIKENINKYFPIPKIPKNMVYIHEGDYFIGSNNKNFKYVLKQEKTHLKGFLIDKYEITNQEFCKFLNVVGNKKEGGESWFSEMGNYEIEKINGKYVVKEGFEKYPVCWVSWYGARAYAEWAGKRLPTEEEWEVAARGGTKNTYPWGNEWDPTKCNWKEDSKIDGYFRSAPVNAFPNGGSSFGCYNMVGNVWEWVIKSKDDIDPINLNFKIHRGGCYKYDKEWQNCLSRIYGKPENSYPCVGFRCVKDIEISRNKK